MNENEIKNRLKHDAEFFAKVFDEELCKQIMNKICDQQASSGSSSVEPPAPSRAGRSHHLVLQYAILICSSVLIGIGIWSLMRHHAPTAVDSLPGTEVNTCQSDSRMNIVPSRVSLTPDSPPGPAYQERPSFSEVPNGTLFNLSVPNPQNLEDITMILLPGHGLVRLGLPEEPQSEAGENLMENESPSNFLDEASEVVRVPMGWILEE